MKTERGVPQDYGKAWEWYRKAAEQGDERAQNNLNAIDMLVWYWNKAMQGDVNAQVDLAIMYEEGKGVQQDYSKAAELYQKAAEQGNKEAQKRFKSILKKYNRVNLYYFLWNIPSTKTTEFGIQKVR